MHSAPDNLVLQVVAKNVVLEHMLTPHTATFVVAPLVLEAVYAGQTRVEDGINVGCRLGRGDGRIVGSRVGCIVGIVVGRQVGSCEGIALVACTVGRALGRVVGMKVGSFSP